MNNHGIYACLNDFVEESFRHSFREAIPLRTLVIYCPDPRAAAIPASVAREFNELWPGELIYDQHDSKVGSTTNVATVITVGGRAVDALRSITILDHMLGLKRVVVVHHTFCGLTGLTADGLFSKFLADQGADISNSFDKDSLCINSFETSLAYDVNLISSSLTTPKHLDIYGFMYDIDEDKLIKVVEKPAFNSTEPLHESGR